MTVEDAKLSGKEKLTWPVIAAAGALLLIVAAILLFSRRGNGAPHIVADPEKIDFGQVKFNTNEPIQIKVTNTGSGVLRFTQAPTIEVLEGC
jgi:hypothetical protein